MTRSKMEAAIRAGLKKSEGMEPSARAGKIADVIELALEMDSEDSPAAPAPTPISAAPRPVLPPAPRAVAPIAISSIEQSDISEPWDDDEIPASPVATDEPEREYWTVEKLVSEISAKAPVTFVLEVEVEGEIKKIKLARNVVADYGLKAVKLCYAEPRYADLEAKVLIFTTTRVIAIDTFMEEIHRQAKGIYRPRQRHIESNTPRPPATLRLEDAMYGGKTEPSEEEKRRLG